MSGWSLHEGFVDDPDALFGIVRDEVEWTSQMKSRQTASMGIPYNYAGASYPEVAWHPALWDVAEKVEASFGFLPTNALLNRYPTGRHSIGFHADDVTILAPETGIVIVSLGAVRTMVLRRPEGDHFHYTRVPMPAGSVLHMTAALQRTHKHAIKREPGAGERISLTFRHLTHAPPPVDRPAWGTTP